MVYASSTLSLAALEYLVHVDVDDVPDDLLAMGIEVPDGALREEVRLDTLPADWNRVEDHPACVEAGDAWARRGESLVLRVPSAIIPEESNTLLNPAHRDASALRVAWSRDFAYDPRLL